MERHGIGTDRTIPTHINNVEKRKYVEVRSGGKSPTDLGDVRQVYRAIDPELASPTIRSRVEEQLDLVASGEAEHASVVAHVLRQFAEKYANFVGAADRMDAPRGELRSRLGRGTNVQQVRPMRPIPHPRRRRKRLYCAAEEETFELPQGLVKLYNGRECGVCGFELLLSAQGDRVYPLCPYCHNHPPFPGGPTREASWAGARTPPEHPEVDRLRVCPCPECDPSLGACLIIEPVGGPRWKLVCTGAR